MTPALRQECSGFSTAVILPLQYVLETQYSLALTSNRFNLVHSKILVFFSHRLVHDAILGILKA